MSELTIYPLFPHTVAVCTLRDTDIDAGALDYVEGLEYIDTSYEKAHSRSCSSSIYNVLDALPRLKSRVLSRFKELKDKYLIHTKNEFVITTSWSTRTQKGEYSKFHNHRNCFYSGVFYFGGDERTGKIRFNNPFRKTWWVESTQANTLNIDQFGIGPQKNMLVFFPSYMDHAIQPHESDQVRYSIAFNLIPVGQLGMEDSAAYIEAPGTKTG